MNNQQNREQAKARAQTLKAQGLTCEEVTAQLKSEGYRKQEPFYRGGPCYGVFTVRKWCKGIASQAGYRNPRLQTDEERKRRKKEWERLWHRRNEKYMKAYFRWYRANFKNKKYISSEQPNINDYR